MPRRAVDNQGEPLYKGSDFNLRGLVGKNISARRRALNITQADLGESMGVSRQTVSQWETGRIEVGAGELPALAIELQVPISHFWSGLDNEPIWSDLIDALPYEMLEHAEDLIPPALLGAQKVTRQEIDLVNDFRSIPGMERAVVIVMVRALAAEWAASPPSYRHAVEMLTADLGGRQRARSTSSVGAKANGDEDPKN